MTSDIVIDMLQQVLAGKVFAESGYPQTDEYHTIWDNLMSECQQARNHGWIVDIPADIPQNPLAAKVPQ